MTFVAAPDLPFRPLRRAAAACLLLSAACADPGDDGGLAPTLRDSAGVRIVTYHLLPDTGVPLAAGQPLLILTGTEGGAAPFERIAGAAVLPDGRIAVADEGASEIRLFTAAGALVARAGRRGDGPGEFRQIDGFGRVGADTLWAYDFGLRRFTLLVPSESTLRPVATIPLEAPLSAVTAAGVLESGDFVVREHWSSTLATASRPGRQRADVAIGAIDRAGALRDTIARVPGREVVVGMEDGRRTMTTPPWARTASAAASGRAVYVGDQTRAEVRVFGEDGHLTRIVRWPPPSPGSAIAWADSLAEIALERTDPLNRPAARQALESLPRPTDRPAHGRLIAGEDGTLWVAPWVPAGEPEPWWWVFDATGALNAVARGIPGFRLLHVDARRIIGVDRDSLDVERVVVYERRD